MNVLYEQAATQLPQEMMQAILHEPQRLEQLVLSDPGNVLAAKLGIVNHEWGEPAPAVAKAIAQHL